MEQQQIIDTGRVANVIGGIAFVLHVDGRWIEFVLNETFKKDH